MKYILIVILALVFIGCNDREPMSGSDMRKAIDECEKHGLVPGYVRYPYSNNPQAIISVTCYPKGLL